MLSCVQLWQHMDCSQPGSSCHGDCPDKNTGVGCHALSRNCKIKSVSFILCVCFLWIICVKTNIKLLNCSNIQPFVLVGCLSNFAGLKKKLGFLNTLLKCNLFTHRGLTVLLRPVDPKVSASPPGPRKSHSWLGF